MKSIKEKRSTSSVVKLTTNNSILKKDSPKSGLDNKIIWINMTISRMHYREWTKLRKWAIFSQCHKDWLQIYEWQGSKQMEAGARWKRRGVTSSLALGVLFLHFFLDQVLLLLTGRKYRVKIWAAKTFPISVNGRSAKWYTARLKIFCADLRKSLCLHAGVLLEKGTHAIHKWFSGEVQHKTIRVYKMRAHWLRIFNYDMGSSGIACSCQSLNCSE